MKFIKFFNEIRVNSDKKPKKVFQGFGSGAKISQYRTKKESMNIFVKEFIAPGFKQNLEDAQEKMLAFLNEYFGYVVFKAVKPNFRYFQIPKKISYKFEVGEAWNPKSFASMNIELITTGLSSGLPFGYEHPDRKSKMAKYFKNFFKISYLIPNFIISNGDLHSGNFVVHVQKMKGYQIDPGVAFGGSGSKEKAFLDINRLDELMRNLFSGSDWAASKKGENNIDFRINMLKISDKKLYTKITRNFKQWEKFLGGDGIGKINGAIDDAKRNMMQRYDTFAIECRKQLVKHFTDVMDSEQDQETKTKAKENLSEMLKTLNENLSGLRQYMIKYIDFHIKPVVKNNVNVIHEYLASQNFE
jgi:hypothetical protein